MDTPKNKGSLYSLGVFFGKALSGAIPFKALSADSISHQSYDAVEISASAFAEQYYYEQFGITVEDPVVTYDDEYFFRQFGLPINHEDFFHSIDTDSYSDLGSSDDDFNTFDDYETIINIDGTPMLDGFGSVDFNGHNYGEGDFSHDFSSHDDHFSSSTDDHF